MATDPAGYWDRDAMIAAFDSLVAANPSRLQKVNIGPCAPIKFLTGSPTPQIPMYKIGNFNSPSALLMDGTCHGGEFGTAEVFYYLVRDILAGTNTILNTMAQKIQLWLIPALNYGYYTSMWSASDSTRAPQFLNSSGQWITNPSPGGSGRYNGDHADLNRAGNVGWGTSSDDNAGAPWVNGVPGEPEVRALMNLWKDTRVKAYINFHCGSNFWNRVKEATSSEVTSVYNPVFSRGNSLASQLGVNPYSQGSSGGGGYLLSAAYAARTTDRIQSWMCEWCPQWRDISGGVYPVPPNKNTVFLAQKTSNYYYGRAFAIMAAIAESLPGGSPTNNLLTLQSDLNIQWTVNGTPEPSGQYQIPTNSQLQLSVPGGVAV